MSRNTRDPYHVQVGCPVASSLFAPAQYAAFTVQGCDQSTPMGSNISPGSKPERLCPGNRYPRRERCWHCWYRAWKVLYRFSSLLKALDASEHAWADPLLQAFCLADSAARIRACCCSMDLRSALQSSRKRVSCKHPPPLHPLKGGQVLCSNLTLAATHAPPDATCPIGHPAAQ